MIEAVAVGSASEMAVSVTEGGLGRLDGARYKSPCIVPQSETEQAAPVTLHFTAVLAFPAAVATTTADPSIGTFTS